ncbi:MFS transporter [Saccharopolyspora cebuensis]|uniref:MFS transporter n=1 Tax=Saccharopolyspora cebuensis TaxID=418759 RepID=A0ABV4CFY6_9PSEU
MRARLETMFRALRHPNYRRWAVADFVSVTGAWMQNLALNWYVLTETGSPGLLGLSLLFQTLPGVLLASWSGALADRWPAKRIIFVTQSLHGLLALVLAACAFLDGPLAGVYAIALVSGVVSVFDGPALGRFGAQLVAREDLSNALGLGSILSSGGRILGMGLAGALVAVTGVPLLFVLNGLSFIAVLVAIARVRDDQLYPLATSDAARTGVKAGLKYVLGHRPLVVMFLLSFVLSCLGRNYQVTMAAMANGPLGAGASGYSTLSVVFAVGTVVGGLVAAAFRQLTLSLLLFAAMITSALQFVSGASGTIWQFAAIMFPIAIGAVVLDTATSTRIQLDTDEDMRGRVLAAKAMVTAASGAVGGPLLGWLSEVSGPGWALEVAGIATVLATGVAWLAFARMPERRALPARSRWARLAEVAPVPQPARPATAGAAAS